MSVFDPFEGGSNLDTTDSSQLFKYTVDTYSNLSGLTAVKEGDLAHVKTTTGGGLFSSKKLKGIYQYSNVSWEYGSQDLQTKLAEQESLNTAQSADILANSAAIINHIADLNNPHQTSSFIANSGRFYSYTNARWVTDSDDNYGGNNFQLNESGGTGTNPIYEWEHLGILLPSGTTLKSLNFACRSNNNQTSDFRIQVVERKPIVGTGWQSGIDADGEMTNTVVYEDTWRNSVGSFSGNMNDLHGAIMPINHTLSDLAMVSIYIKPIETNSATRYILATWTWEII